MASATPQIIPQESQDAIIQYHKQSYGMLNQQWNIREMMREIDLGYIRELDWTSDNWKAIVANQYGDPTKFRNIILPIIMPQVEAAVEYQSSVFLQGYPIFGWVAPPGQEDAAQQFQAITEENQIRGGWIQQFIIWFRDLFKYNLGFIEVTWDRINTWPVETDMGFMQGKQGLPKQTIWQGNCLRRWDPYNTYFDTRYNPTDIYKDGEFIGHTELMSRIHLKKFLAELPDGMVQNYRAAFQSGLGLSTIGVGGIESFYQPLINPRALMQVDRKRSVDWMAWAGLLDRPKDEILYKNIYEVSTLYARILPMDFKLRVPAPNTVQIWKFIIVNHQVLVYAERQTNAHANLPVLIGQPNEDGLGFQTKSLAMNAEGFQAVGSALINSVIASRRRAISDRAIYDPSRISEAAVNSDSPTAKIPLRPSAYGKPISEAYYAIPFRDDQAPIAFQEISQIFQYANLVNGQNQSRQGQFVKGNKTLHEYADVMQNANGRDQMTSMLLEGQVMTPIKEILKSNILQYQPSGIIYSSSLQAPVTIDPIALRKAMVTYKITDGLDPTDKVISADEFAVALQTVATSPAIASGYNVAPMFSYLMKTRNLDLSPFEKSPAQVAYEQAMAQWQQMAQLAIQKGTQFQTPQPTPQQYGYDPNQQNPANQSQQSAQQQPIQVPNGTNLSNPSPNVPIQ